MAKRYEMLWDCASCGTRKLLGLTHRHCPNCGAVQDPKRRYFPAEGEEVAVEGHQYVGVDLACPACRSPNSAAAGHCINCGHGLEGASPVALHEDPASPQAGAAAADASKPPARSPGGSAKPLWGSDAWAAERGLAPEPDPPASPAVPEARPRKRHWLKAIAGLALSALVGVFWTHEVTVTPTQHNWTRTIDIERLTPTSETAWRDQMPSGAYSVSCHQAVREERQVADGQSCSDVRKDLGDGTFTTETVCSTRYRSEKVYGDECQYTIDRWRVIRTSEARGSSVEDEPRWPAVVLGRTGNCVGCEREGQRREDYQLTFSYNDRVDTCHFAQARWKAIERGLPIKAKARVATGGLACGSLE